MSKAESQQHQQQHQQQQQQQAGGVAELCAYRYHMRCIHEYNAVTVLQHMVTALTHNTTHNTHMTCDRVLQHLMWAPCYSTWCLH